MAVAETRLSLAMVVSPERLLFCAGNVSRCGGLRVRPMPVCRGRRLWQHRTMTFKPRASARKPSRRLPAPVPEPTEAALHDAALRYLSRYASTRIGLLRVLDRRIGKWAASGAGDGDAARTAGEAARRVVAALAESGAVDDQAFAQSRGASLRRAGKSTRAIGAHLSAKGVPGDITSARRIEETAEEAEGEDSELGAAAVHLRRRRLGAFRTAADTPQLRKRELASLARAGFPHGVAAAALRLTEAEAEALIIRFRASIP